MFWFWLGCLLVLALLVVASLWSAQFVECLREYESQEEHETEQEEYW